MKETIFVAFDVDDINPMLEDGLENLIKLKEIFPDLIFTLFMPTMYHGFYYDIDLAIQKYKKLLGSETIVGNHGVFHFTINFKDFWMNNKEMQTIIKNGFFKPFDKIVKGPGWSMSQEAYNMLIEHGYKVMLHPKEYNKLTVVNIHEKPDFFTTNYLLFHSHIAGNEGADNDISNSKVFKNVVKMIKELKKNYNVIFIDGIQLMEAIEK